MVGWCSGVFFFKQKTEYEMRISDWSSDVCSSDLQNIEALRNTGLKSIVTLDDRFIDLGTTDNVVRLHRQHLLQGVGSAISLQCPDLHLTEALAAELRLRSEEHTSELQSLMRISYSVFCLKNKNNENRINYT